MSGAAISWRCKKQTSIALSSTEAEYVSLSEAAKEATYFRKLWKEIFKVDICFKLFCDNQSAIAIANNPVHHERTKHIDIRCHFIRELIDKNEIKLFYIPTQEMVADGFTKRLNGPKQKLFQEMVGVTT